MTDSRNSDEVLKALDALVVVLLDNTRRNQDTTQRVLTIRRLRGEGRSYREILGHAEAHLILKTTTENLDGLLQASGRLRRAEARALYEEGMTMDEIATLFGVTRQRVSVLLRDATHRAERRNVRRNGSESETDNESVAPESSVWGCSRSSTSNKEGDPMAAWPRASVAESAGESGPSNTGSRAVDGQP